MLCIKYRCNYLKFESNDNKDNFEQSSIYSKIISIILIMDTDRVSKESINTFT